MTISTATLHNLYRNHIHTALTLPEYPTENDMKLDSYGKLRDEYDELSGSIKGFPYPLLSEVVPDLSPEAVIRYMKDNSNFDEITSILPWNDDTEWDNEGERWEQVLGLKESIRISNQAFYDKVYSLYPNLRAECEKLWAKENSYHQD